MNSYSFKNLLNSACWVIFHAFVIVCLLFFKINFFEKNLSGTLSSRVSNSLDPDLDPNCLQRLSTDDKVTAGKLRFKSMCTLDKDQGLYIFHCFPIK